MAINSILYPSDYPSINTIEIETEVEYLSLQVLKNTLKQVENIRDTGLVSIKNQVELLDGELGKMRSELTGQNVTIRSASGVNDIPQVEVKEENIPSGFKGTTGYFMGGDRSSSGGIALTTEKRKISKLFFIGEIIQSLSNNLTESTQWSGVGGVKEGAWIFGSWNTLTTVVSDHVDKVNYKDEVVYRLESKLSEKKHSMGIANNKAFAYLIGGGTSSWNEDEEDYPFKRYITKWTFLTSTETPVASGLATGRSSEPNLKGTRTDAWIFGGVGRDWVISNLVERFSFITEVVETESVSVSHSFAGYTSSGNNLYLYLCGGKSNNSVTWKEGESFITRFDIERRTATRLGITLSKGRTAPLGNNNSQNAYIAGGWSGQNSSPSTNIEKLSSFDSDPFVSTIGIALQEPRAEGCGISDYGETFY